MFVTSISILCSDRRKNLFVTSIGILQVKGEEAMLIFLYNLFDDMLSDSSFFASYSIPRQKTSGSFTNHERETHTNLYGIYPPFLQIFMLRYYFSSEEDQSSDFFKKVLRSLDLVSLFLFVLVLVVLVLAHVGRVTRKNPLDPILFLLLLIVLFIIPL